MAKVRELKFIEEYLVDGNATRAAIAAGYSKKTAHVAGHKLVRKNKAEIDSRLEAMKAKSAKKLEITKERIILEVARIALLDAGDFYDALGNPIEIPDLPARARRAIQGFEFTEDYLNAKDKDGNSKSTAAGYTKKYKLADKLRGLELLAKLTGHYVEKKDINLHTTVEELVLKSMEGDGEKGTT